MEQVENRTLEELKFGDTASLAHTLTYKRAQLRGRPHDSSACSKAACCKWDIFTFDQDKCTFV